MKTFLTFEGLTYFFNKLVDKFALQSHTHTDYASSVKVSGNGNAITAISQSGNTITATKDSTFLTEHPNVAVYANTTSSVSPAHGKTFTAIDNITKDEDGHVVSVNTKTVTMPTETELSKGTDATDAKTLSYGETFAVVTDTLVNGHEVTDVVTSYTLPSVDSTLNTTSTNPVQNKAILAKIESSAVSTLATAQNYTDDVAEAFQAQLDAKASKGQGILYIVGTGNTPGVWFGSHDDILEYFDGLTIAYKVPVAGDTTSTKLNINNLGAVSVVRNANTAISTAFPADSVILITYTTDGGVGYWKVADYDTNTKSTTSTSNQVDTKLYLAGAPSQGTDKTTYSNVNCFIGDDNCLYSGGIKTATTEDIDALEEMIGYNVNQAVFDAHVANANNPHNVQLSQLGVNASATELNYVKGVTSSIQDQLDLKVPVSRTVNGKSLSANISLSASDVGADSSGTAVTAVGTHNTSNSAHNDIRNLISTLTERLNTLADSDEITLDQMSEIVAYIRSNKSLIEDVTTNKVNVADVIDNLATNENKKPLSAAQGVVLKALIDALQAEVDSKAKTSVVTAHTGNKDNPHEVTLTQLGVNVDASKLNMLANVTASAAELNVLDGIAVTTAELNHSKNLSGNIQEQLNEKALANHTHSEYVNQNAFGKIVVGDTTISADSANDTIMLVAGENVNFIADAANDKITINSSDTIYTHPDHTPHANGIYKITVNGLGHIIDAIPVTKADLTNLGIPGQDTTYEGAGAGLGLVKTGGDVEIIDGVITVNDNSHNHTVSNITGLQITLNDMETRLGSMEAYVGSGMIAITNEQIDSLF